VELAPGARSALLHRHSHSQEFVYILAGTPVLRLDADEHELAPGMCIGFRPDGPAHYLVNRSNAPACYLEIGDRDPDDGATYPEDDLVAARHGDGWRAGEDLGWGTGERSTPNALVDAWLASDHHRRILLSGTYREIGVGVAAGAPRPTNSGLPGATYAMDLGTIRPG